MKIKNILAVENSVGNLLINIGNGQQILHLNLNGEYFPSKHENLTGTPMTIDHWDERVKYANTEPFTPNKNLIKALPKALGRRKQYLEKISGQLKNRGGQKMHSTNESSTTGTLGNLVDFEKLRKKFKT